MLEIGKDVNGYFISGTLSYNSNLNICVVSDLNMTLEEIISIMLEYGADEDGWPHFKKLKDIKKCLRYLESLGILNKIIG